MWTNKEIRIFIVLNGLFFCGITNGYASFVFKLLEEDSYIIALSNEGRKIGPKGIGQRIFEE